MTVLEAIASQFLDERGWSRKTPLPRDQVREWLASNDLEVLSAAFGLLQKGGFARVESPLTPKEKQIALCGFFERALTHAENVLARVQNGGDDDEDIADYEWPINISHALVYWVADFLRDEATPEQERELVLAWVRDLVLHRPSSSSLTTAVLDHLIWNHATRRTFKSWPKDSELAFLFAA